MKSHNSEGFLVQDIAIIFFSILIALVLIKTNTLSTILDGAQTLKLFGSFIAGIFFTSVFTTAPAIVSLGQIAQHNSLVLTALFGAAGSVIGDLIIFAFIRDRLSEHLAHLMEHTTYWNRVKALFRMKYFRWGTFLLGGLIISSPIPDEIAISLMGISKVKTSSFVFISFVFNFIGILCIGLVARAI